jgi:hypothetical protein
MVEGNAVSVPVPRSPDCYWVLPGEFLAGEYPGHRDDAEATRKLRALVDAGIRVFVDLTEAGEQDLRPYAQLLEGLSEPAEPLTYHRLPIRDVNIPTITRMREIQTVLQDALADGRPVYVHCWGGTGRTGTVVGCWLVEHGEAEPLPKLRQLRAGCAKYGRRSPDTAEQERFVRQWAQYSRRRDGV